LPKATENLPTPGLRPEAELLLCAAGTLPPETRSSRIRELLSHDIDWDAVLRLAMHNRIPTLLYRHLEDAGGEGVPDQVLKQLRSYFKQTSMRNMFLARELVAVLDAFDEAGIQALPYKGPLLAQSLYGNMGLRQFWDLDILVRREDVLKAKELLVARGYRPEMDLTREEEMAHLDYDCEYNFDRDDGRVHLEIHWRVLPEPFSYDFDSDYVWKQAVPAELVSKKTLTLPPEALFLILCMHGGDKHQWGRLKWISDIAHFIAAHPRLDWDRVLDEAARLGRTQTVALGLHLPKILLGTEIPEAAARRLRRDPRTSALAGLVRGRLFREGFGLPGFSEWLSYVEAEGEPVARGGSIFERARQFFRYARAVLRPEFCDRYTLALPPWMSFMTYFYRTWRLARMHKGDLISRLR
jgi:hypothetical protein